MEITGYSTSIKVHKYDTVPDPLKDSLFNKINNLIEQQFYGSFEMKFENGKIVHCRKTESIKL